MSQDVYRLQSWFWAYDQLPQRFRRMLADAEFNWDPRPLLDAIRDGVPDDVIFASHARNEIAARKADTSGHRTVADPV